MLDVIHTLRALHAHLSETKVVVEKRPLSSLATSLTHSEKAAILCSTPCLSGPDRVPSLALEGCPGLTSNSTSVGVIKYGLGHGLDLRLYGLEVGLL